MNKEEIKEILKTINFFLNTEKYFSDKMLTDYNLVMEAYSLVIERAKLTMKRVNKIFDIVSPSTISIESYLISMCNIINYDIELNKKHDEMLAQKELAKKKEEERKEKAAQDKIDAETKRREYKYESIEKRKIEDWIKDALSYYTNFDFVINDDLVIDFHRDVYLEKYLVDNNITELPYKIGLCHGDFNISYAKLTSVKNFPYEVMRFSPCISLPYKDEKSREKNYYRDEEYLKFLESVEGGEEILEYRSKLKKYITFFYNKEEKKIFVVSKEDFYCHVQIFMKKDKNFKKGDSNIIYHSCEEDLGLYEIGDEWTKEDFNKRNPEAEFKRIEQEKLDKIKKAALSKLSDEEKNVLNLN